VGTETVARGEGVVNGGACFSCGLGTVSPRTVAYIGVPTHLAICAQLNLAPGGTFAVFCARAGVAGLIVWTGTLGVLAADALPLDARESEAAESVPQAAVLTLLTPHTEEELGSGGLESQVETEEVEATSGFATAAGSC
jgi:hypothetical protein